MIFREHVDGVETLPEPIQWLTASSPARDAYRSPTNASGGGLGTGHNLAEDLATAEGYSSQ